MEIRDFAVNGSFSGNGLWQWYEKPGLSGPAETKIWLDRILVATMKRLPELGYLEKPLDTTESGVMPIEEIRVPAPAWSNSFLEQNRFFIDIGLDLVFLVIAISPIVIRYFKRKSHRVYFDLFCLVVAGIGLVFARAYALSVLPSYLAVMINRNTKIGFAVLLISILSVVWRIEKFNYGFRCILGLAAFIFVGFVFLIVGTLGGDNKAPARLRCGQNLKLLSLGLQNANDARWIEMDKSPPLNASRVNAGPEVSWRVKLLPYIELDHVYQQYEFKSPWDSQTNWAIACRRVELFTCPSEPDMTNPNGGRFTSYVMLENTNKNQGNPNLVYDQDRKLLDANRILLIESCGANVVWTEPRDADVDTLRWSLKPANRKEEKEPWRSTNVGASSHAGVVQVVYGDGSTRLLSKSIDEGVLRKVILGQASDDELD